MKKDVGILLHISSLPSETGIGTFGKSAYDFVDFLASLNLSIWQILPLNLTSFGDSPYQSPSNYGYNYYFIDLDTLVSKGLLTKEDYSHIDFGQNEDRVNYELLFNNRIKVLKKAFSNFKYTDEFKNFLKEDKNASDFALFMTMKELNNFKSWDLWEEQLNSYSEELEAQVKEKHKGLFEFYAWTQYEFLSEFFDLKKYANSKNIKIMGDIPIYLSYDSVECYKYPKMFQFDEHHKPTSVAGCPPDCFSVDGQLWGNPLYNRDYLKSTNYKWWNDRIYNALKLYDLVRIDHFRGFSAYYSIPYKDKTAKNGKWVKGPGFDLFKDKLNLPIVAEDLGYIDDDFRKLMKETNYPGMKILIQGLEDLHLDNEWRPRNYTEKYFSYTSTHDSETTLQYLNNLTNEKRKVALEVVKEEFEYFNIPFNKEITNEDLVYKLIELNIRSKSKASIIPMQDLLCIGKEGRMNFPSTLSTLNWSWKVNKSDFLKKESRIRDFFKKMDTF
ncbi:MAG: 4-alpha-glucanotransferase [Firmicutes bacterium]|uniref:4-alpha-glucanotransferase n=1 Tax=Candidatus Onthovivens merdipullorum TaxID=2840889 RepID=A0A9D9DI94_9BACL|nr:4-alpha-glucanotransferase [Candidatus Onthovivens merdipullorum]